MRYRVPRFGPTPQLCWLYRKAREITQTQAAEHFAISLRAWQYYEAGERRPRRAVLDRLVEYLNSTET